MPTSEISDGIEKLLERQRIRTAITDALPQVTDTIEAPDDKPVLKLPHPDGRYIVVAPMKRAGIVRWVVAVPDGDEPTIHEPTSMDGYVEVVRQALTGPKGASTLF